jgi:hypothetical protein
MNPKTVRKLREGSPEFKELLTYLATQAMEANSLEGLEKMTFQERAYEASVRIKVFNRLKDILAPLVTDQELSTLTPLQEYAM